MSARSSQSHASSAVLPLSDAPKKERQRDRQRAATRERVFLAAVEEFLHVGFTAAHIDRIAAAARVSRGTFYFHFPTKEHVLVEIQRRSTEATIERLAELRATRPTLRDIISCLIDSVGASERLLGESELIRDVLALFVRGSSEGGPDTQSSPLADALASLLEDTEARGELREGLAVDQVALIVMTSVFGLLVNQSSAEPDRALSTDQLIDVLVRGLER